RRPALRMQATRADLPVGRQKNGQVAVVPDGRDADDGSSLTSNDVQQIPRRESPMRSKYAPGGTRPPCHSARWRVPAVIVGLAVSFVVGVASAAAAPSLASWPSYS